jgi:hypothetical protein
MQVMKKFYNEILIFAKSPRGYIRKKVDSWNKNAGTFSLLVVYTQSYADSKNVVAIEIQNFYALQNACGNFVFSSEKKSKAVLSLAGSRL